MPDNDDEVGGDFIAADERDLVVVRIGHRKLALEDVQEADGSDDLCKGGALSLIITHGQQVRYLVVVGLFIISLTSI